MRISQKYWTIFKLASYMAIYFHWTNLPAFRKVPPILARNGRWRVWLCMLKRNIVAILFQLLETTYFNSHKTKPNCKKKKKSAALECRTNISQQFSKIEARLDQNSCVKSVHVKVKAFSIFYFSTCILIWTL